MTKARSMYDLDELPRHAPNEDLAGLTITLRLGECVTINGELVVIFVERYTKNQIKLRFHTPNRDHYVVRRGDVRE